MNETGMDRGSRKVNTESGKKISSAYKTNMYVVFSLYATSHCLLPIVLIDTDLDICVEWSHSSNFFPVHSFLS